MNNFQKIAIAFIAANTLLGCQPEDSAAINCQDEIIEVEDVQYCVKRSPITETGFECPLDFDNLFLFDELAVCGPDPQMPPEHEVFFEEGFPIDRSYDPNPEESPDDDEITEYDEIKGTAPLYREIEFYELLSPFDHAAHFHIKRIYTNTTEVNIFVELELLDSWGDSINDTLIAKIPGGPLPGDEDVFSVPQLSIAKGENVVLFFNLPAEGDDFIELTLSVALFRPLDDGNLTNGVHFSEEGISVNDLQYLVEETRNSTEECETE